LVDFENLKPAAEEIALVRGEHYRLWVFHGPHQNKFDAPMVKAWQPLGERVDFVQSSRQGKNALDFHIAYQLGVLRQRHQTAGSTANYVVVTGDGGFDALFEHMRSNGVQVGKAGSMSEALALAESWRPKEVAPPAMTRPSRGIIPAVKAPAKSAPPKKTAAGVRKAVRPEDVPTVVAELRAHPRNRPGDRKALERYVLTRLGNKVAPDVVLAVIRALETQKVVTFQDKGIEYRIPKAK
jgi:hypothetical protein